MGTLALIAGKTRRLTPKETWLSAPCPPPNDLFSQSSLARIATAAMNIIDEIQTSIARIVIIMEDRQVDFVRLGPMLRLQFSQLSGSIQMAAKHN